MDAPPQPLLTLEQVAKVLKVDRSTVSKLRLSGQLPAVLIGRSVRIRQSDLEKYIVSRLTSTQ